MKKYIVFTFFVTFVLTGYAQDFIPLNRSNGSSSTVSYEYTQEPASQRLVIISNTREISLSQRNTRNSNNIEYRSPQSSAPVVNNYYNYSNPNRGVAAYVGLGLVDYLLLRPRFNHGYGWNNRFYYPRPNYGYDYLNSYWRTTNAVRTAGWWP